MAQALASDFVKEIPSDAVLVGDDSPRQRGRPLKLTVQKFLKICSWIEQGRTNTNACRLEGVHYTGFATHLRNKPRWRKRYELADAARNAFLQDLHLNNIQRHAKECWAASAWLLERKFPSLFALHFKDRDTESAEQPVGNELPAEVLARHRALMLELAREDEAKQAQKTLCE